MDGSESTSNQWELELQASMEKLNNLPFRACVNDKTESVNNCDSKNAQVTKCTKDSSSVVSNGKYLKNDQNDRPRQFDDIYQGWQSLTQSPINSIINRSKIAFKNSISKSLSNSPVNMGAFSFGKPKMPNTQANECSSSSIQNHDNKGSSHNPTNNNYATPEQCSASNDVNQKDCITEKGNTRNLCETRETSNDPPTRIESQIKPSHLSIDDFQVQNVSKTHSLDSTPVRVNYLSSSAFTNSLNNGLSGEVERAQNNVQSDCLSPRTKELPLLSFFQKSTVLKPSKDKSCSMVDLNEKQNLKTLLDKSNLGNIQAISVEKLANARHKLVGDS